jgi:hypothetical protein
VVQVKKALTQQEGPNICWEADKMMLFKKIESAASCKKRLQFCQHPDKRSVLFILSGL